MTITVSLLLVLLFLSLHACNARKFAVVHNYSTKESRSPIISKENDENLNPGIEAERKNSVAKAAGEAKTEEKSGKYLEVKDSGIRKTWRVPHRKRSGEQEPGFNLDYLPPKTHPPVHN